MIARPQLRGVTSTNGDGLASVTADEQFARGMYMIGQVAALRDKVTTIAELHADVSSAVASLQSKSAFRIRTPRDPPPCDIAIVGLSCFYPNATSLWQYWENILAKTNAVIEIPPHRTGTGGRTTIRTPAPSDKMVSKWGGFMSGHYCSTRSSTASRRSRIPNIEPLQLLLLEAVNQALGDAGYLEAAVRTRTHVRHSGRGRRRDAVVGRVRVPGVYAAGRFDSRRARSNRKRSSTSAKASCRSGPKIRFRASC